MPTPGPKLSPILTHSAWKSPCPQKHRSVLSSQPWVQEGPLQITTISPLLCKKFM